MITIKKSPTADTRTCEFAGVSKATLLTSSIVHIDDVRKGLLFFGGLLNTAACKHDEDKIADIDGFHADFVTGFGTTTWWDRHRAITRHHINWSDGVPPDVNLIDVLEYITDCVMAGMARTGSVYQVTLNDETLRTAFANTVQLLVSNVVVEPESPAGTGVDG